ncbi:unnamed protein product [Orchesella dallaii]|uniref:Peptidase M28 domain-containing protein n=1 Tax=Orchesella dallaii TaxID=48710 RepID=A0ABP1S3Y8_9HEXA
MSFKCLLIVSLIIVAAMSLEERPPGKRLIKYDMKEPAKWMTLEEINQLTDGKRKTLIDLTRRWSGLQPGAAQGRQHEKEYKLPDHARFNDTVRKLIPQIKMDRLKSFVKKLSSFHSRNAQIFFGATQAEGWLRKEIKTILADFKGSSSINYIAIPKPEDGERYLQDNIIVRIKGNGKNTEDQLVILGAHYDSIIGFDNFDPVLRILTQSGTKLKYNVEFHFYTAEEYDLSGSGDVVNHNYGKYAPLIGMLNLDRIGYGNYLGVDDSDKIWEITEILFTDQTSWDNLSYPAVSLMETEFNNDTIEHVNFELVKDFTKVAIALMVELGEPGSASLQMQVEWTMMGVSFVGMWLLY